MLQLSFVVVVGVVLALLLVGVECMDEGKRPGRKEFVPPENTVERNTRHRRLQTPCYGDWELWTDKGCSYSKLVEKMEEQKAQTPGWECGHSIEQELKWELGASSLDEVKLLVWRACRQAYDNRKMDHFLPFSAISGENNAVWDQAFFNGGTDWNDMRQTRDINGITRYQTWAHPNSVINAAYWAGAQYDAGINWPEIDNFKNCRFNAVNCCWTKDRQAEDDNGECEKDYDEMCANADPIGNTDVCYMDMSRSPSSNNVRSGFALYETKAEDSVHCHGFVWADDANHPLSVYKGNLAYYVGMFDHLSERGYAKNVPGAPMCACVEQMPTVTRSDCTTLEVKQQWVQFNRYAGVGLSFNIHYSEVEYMDCPGAEEGVVDDLVSYYRLTVQQGLNTQANLDKLTEDFIVGEGMCEPAIESFLDSQWLLPKSSTQLTGDESGRMIYTLPNTNYEDGIGADSYNTMVGYDTDWGFKSVACSSNKADRCYLIVNYVSSRRLFAQKDKTGSDGVGASSGRIQADHKWRVIPTTCNDSTKCYYLENDFSGRKIYAESGQTGRNGFGADSVTQARRSMVFRISGVDNFK